MVILSWGDEIFYVYHNCNIVSRNMEGVIEKMQGDDTWFQLGKHGD